ncbi:MAG: hypothetical protein Q9227_008363 [Pyrenula ochraceoflavens]
MEFAYHLLEQGTLQNAAEMLIITPYRSQAQMYYKAMEWMTENRSLNGRPLDWDDMPRVLTIAEAPSSRAKWVLFDTVVDSVDANSQDVDSEDDDFYDVDHQDNDSLARDCNIHTVLTRADEKVTIFTPIANIMESVQAENKLEKSPCLFFKLLADIYKSGCWSDYTISSDMPPMKAQTALRSFDQNGRPKNFKYTKEYAERIQGVLEEDIAQNEEEAKVKSVVGIGG